MSTSSLVTRTIQCSPVKFTGHFTPKQHASVLTVMDMILRGRGDFARQIGSWLELTNVSAYEWPEDGKMHVEVVLKIDMNEGKCQCPIFPYIRYSLVAMC